MAITSDGAKAVMDDGDIKTLYKDLEEKARQEEAASLKEDQDLEKAEKTETPL